MPTLNLQVAASSDDAHQFTDGSGFAVTTTAINISSSTSASSRYEAGFRFNNVTIPPGSTIDSAILSVYVISTSRDDPECDIYGDDVDDSPTFSSGANDVVSRTNTTATVGWSDTAIGTGFKSPSDIKTIVQEITDRGGWSSGNNLSILLRGRNSATKFLQVRSYDGDTTQAATLDITYTEPVTITPVHYVGKISNIRLKSKINQSRAFIL